jgi:hypothetical protein
LETEQKAGVRNGKPGFRVDNDLGEVGGLGRAGARGDREAFLDQRRQPLLTHPLTPARQRRAVEGQFVPEELFAAEELIIRILDPARAQILIGEIVHVLEDRKPSHQARRLSGLVGIDRAEPLLEKTPVDRPAELGERVVQVDDLVEPSPKKIVLQLSRRSLGRIESPSVKPTERQNHHQTSGSIRKKTSRQTLISCKRNNLPIPANASRIRRCRILHGQ